MNSFINYLLDEYNIQLKEEERLKHDYRKLEYLFPKYFLNENNIGEIFCITDSIINGYKVYCTKVQLIGIINKDNQRLLCFKQKEKVKLNKKQNKKRYNRPKNLKNIFSRNKSYNGYYDVYRTCPEVDIFTLSMEELANVTLNGSECYCRPTEKCEICNCGDFKIQIIDGDDDTIIDYYQEPLLNIDYEDYSSYVGFNHYWELFDGDKRIKVPDELYKSKDLSAYGVITKNILKYLEDDREKYFKKLNNIRKNEPVLFLSEKDIGKVILEPDIFFSGINEEKNKELNKFIFLSFNNEGEIKLRTDNKNFNKYFMNTINILDEPDEEGIYHLNLEYIEMWHLKLLAKDYRFKSNCNKNFKLKIINFNNEIKIIKKIK